MYYFSAFYTQFFKVSEEDNKIEAKTALYFDWYVI